MQLGQGALDLALKAGGEQQLGLGEWIRAVAPWTSQGRCLGQEVAAAAWSGSRVKEGQSTPGRQGGAEPSGCGALEEEHHGQIRWEAVVQAAGGGRASGEAMGETPWPQRRAEWRGHREQPD